MAMPRGSSLYAVLFLSCLIGDALCRSMYGCLKDFEAGPWATYDPPTFPRGLAKAQHHSAEAAQHVYNLYSQHLTLPEMAIQRGMTSKGDSTRMRALFHKLRQGKPITMVAMGGSITCGADTSRLEQQYTWLVFAWINATFPHANHTYLNRCRPATQSMLIGACLSLYIPPEPVDLVLLEYTLNDDQPAEFHGIKHLPQMENEYRRGFERFLRKLLKEPSKPALLYLHVYQPWFSMLNFWSGAEMEQETILQYYGIPSVSARNAMYQLMKQEVHAFSDDDAHCGVHPNPLGHRYYGDLLIAAMQDQAYAAFTIPDDHMQYPHGFEALTGLPPPMLEDNFDFDSECLSGEQLREVGVPELSENWEFVDEGKPGGKPKLGFRTLLPDTELVLQINTKSSVAHIEGDIMLAVGYLVSYEGMGLFSIQCASGCECEGVYNVSGTHMHHTSVSMFKYFSASQHEQCRLKVTSKHDEETGGDKVKIDTLMVATAISGNPRYLFYMNNLWPEGHLILGGH